jgi:hypothetical protein
MDDGWMEYQLAIFTTTYLYTQLTSHYKKIQKNEDQVPALSCAVESRSGSGQFESSF